MATRSLIAALAGVVLLAGCGSSSSSSSTTSTPAASSTTTATTASTSLPCTTGEMGFEAVPIECGVELAPASTTGNQPVDGIHCAPIEQLAYHIHAHLAVYDNGALRPLPGGIGIPGSQVEQTQEGPVALGGQCYYWLHTHAPDGVIHIESPTKRIYTLGQFFDEWHQPLTSDQVGNVKGKITAFVNGKVWTKSVRDIPLLPHLTIQFNVGEPAVPFQKVDWSRTQL
jgi:hypothetical protein